MRLQHVIVYNLIALLWLTTPFPAGNDWTHKIGAWLEMPATAAQADAIVVLGGAAKERLPVAIELFRDGLAPELWYTGAVDDTREGDGTSAQLAAKRAQEMGVPSEAITLLASSSTWEDGQQIAATAQARGSYRILVVTDSTSQNRVMINSSVVMVCSFRLSFHYLKCRANHDFFN